MKAAGFIYIYKVYVALLKIYIYIKHPEIRSHAI